VNQAPAAPAAVRGRLARLAMQMSRDKADTLLLLAATVLVLAPHAAHLPAWISALCASTLAWRAAITFRGKRMPPSFVLLPLAMAAMGGVFLAYKTLLGREAGVAMAVLLVAFKMLEMHARRDLFVVIFLCFFLLLTNFFYSQSIGMGLMMVAAIIALLTAQLSFHYTGAVPPLGRRLLLGAKILGIAAPLALVLFVLFPRIQGPLWGMPRDAASGRTGLSNSMAPGNISNLAQSDEVAFRVRFRGRVPGQPQLYWRAIVMGDFDGRTWSQAQRGQWRAPRDERVSLNGAPVQYQVTLEAHSARWLFALDLPGSIPALGNNEAGLTGDFELRAFNPIDQRVRYDLGSHLSYRLDGGAELPDGERWRALPAGFNPQAMQAGLALRSEPDPAARVNQVLAWFRNDGFSYTLEPPLLGTNSVDDFLYRTKAGFCEHYASAFVFLMRAADVPARVLTGYQGGEINPIDNFMVVRQSDAHAWAEVWLGKRGWVRVDPTAAVSPDRIERNLARALPPDATFNLAQLGNLIDIDSQSWLGQLRFRLGAVNNAWNQWVLNYDPQRRRGFLDALAEGFLNGRTLAALAAVCCLIIIARALRSRRQKDSVDALYSALCQQLGRLGMARAGDEGPNAYALRIARTALAPARKEAILRFLQLYSAHKYGAQRADPALLPTLKSLFNSST